MHIIGFVTLLIMIGRILYMLSWPLVIYLWVLTNAMKGYRLTVTLLSTAWPRTGVKKTGSIPQVVRLHLNRFVNWPRRRQGNRRLTTVSSRQPPLQML